MKLLSLSQPAASPPLLQMHGRCELVLETVFVSTELGQAGAWWWLVLLLAVRVSMIDDVLSARSDCIHYTD